MSDFDENFAVNVAFPQSVAAYTAAGFGETCTGKQPQDFGAFKPIKVDPSTCKKVWADPDVSPRAKSMLESVMTDPDNFGFIAVSQNTCAIAFRGTRTVPDFLKDIQIDPAPGRFGEDEEAPRLPGRVHSGFQALYRTLRPSLEETLSNVTSPENLALTVTGHSLGAALAILCALDPITQPFAKTPRKVYTFAGPRVGDNDFADAFDRAVEDCYRIVNLPDIVPHLPLAIPYRHVGKAVVIDGSQFSLDILLDAHVLCGGYLRGLNRMITVGHKQPIIARQ